MNSSKKTNCNGIILRVQYNEDIALAKGYEREKKKSYCLCNFIITFLFNKSTYHVAFKQSVKDTQAVFLPFCFFYDEHIESSIEWCEIPFFIYIFD